MTVRDIGQLISKSALTIVDSRPWIINRRREASIEMITNETQIGAASFPRGLYSLLSANGSGRMTWQVSERARPLPWWRCCRQHLASRYPRTGITLLVLWFSD